MKEKKKLLVILCTAFVCLLGVLGVLLVTEENAAGNMEHETAESGFGEEPGGATVTGEEAEYPVCVLSDFAQDEIEKIEIQNTGAEYTILSSPVLSGERAEVRSGDALEETVFVLAGYEEYRQDQERLNTAVRLLSSVSATRIDQGDFDKAKYGLQNPGATVKISGKRDSVTFYLGSWNESASVWYAMKEGDEGLYGLSKGVGDKMMETPFSLLDMTLIEDFDSASEEMTQRLTRILVERPDLEEPLEIVAAEEAADAYTSSYELISPVRVKTSLKAAREQIASLFGLSAKEAVGVYDPDTASAYGLDRPSMEMTVSHDGVELKLTVGDSVPESGNKERYFTCSDSDLLYIIEENGLPFFDDTVDDLFFKMALLPKLDQLEEVYINLRGEEYLFSLAFEGAEEEETQTKETENAVVEAGTENKTETLRVSLGGKELDAGLFRTFYSFLLEVDIEKINRDSHSGELLMVLEYRYRDGRCDRLAAYQMEDVRRMGIAVNNEASFEGRIAYLDKLQTELSHLLAGEEIDTNW